MSSVMSTSLYIVGAENFRNELLCHFLSRELETRCVIDEELNQVENEQKENKNGKRLILIDTCDRDMSRLFIDYSRIKSLVPYVLPALINLEYGTGVEIEALRKGVKGFFYLHDTVDLFLKGVKSILSGQIWVSRDLLTEYVLDENYPRIASGARIGKGGVHSLSKREQEIISMVSVGSKNNEIADKLYISPNTVKTHLYNIYKKINVEDRLQAVLWAAKHLK